MTFSICSAERVNRRFPPTELNPIFKIIVVRIDPVCLLICLLTPSKSGVKLKLPTIRKISFSEWRNSSAWFRSTRAPWSSAAKWRNRWRRCARIGRKKEERNWKRGWRPQAFCGEGRRRSAGFVRVDKCWQEQFLGSYETQELRFLTIHTRPGNQFRA